MAEALKNQFGPEIPKRIAAMIKAVFADFDAAQFLRLALAGYEPLNLMARGRHIAAALRQTLPADYPSALKILLGSLGAPATQTQGNGMAPFLYLPHVSFVAAYGLDHFEESMDAQYELTQRFTAEFSIRPFIARYPEASLATLRLWATDPNEHVRRLVSEGTRPRLPWAPRLAVFADNPGPVIELLETLRDDPSLYVRRSVANHLNDLGKDHPSLLVDIIERWQVDAGAERLWLIRHALRSALKRTEPGALKALGYHQRARVELIDPVIAPKRPKIGDAVRLGATLRNPGGKSQRLLVDLRVHFVKANGQTAPKVFKLRELALAASAEASVCKKISLAELTTRKHYPGRHRVELLINGAAVPLGEFDLRRP